MYFLCSVTVQRFYKTAFLVFAVIINLQFLHSSFSQEDAHSKIENASEQNITSLEELSLEELMNITITSVSKKPQELYSAAAAVYVIHQEDIRRSGARTLPDVFRMVPGLNVSKLDASKWAVSARGFTSRYSGKLLVLLDGKTIYTPLFSGVYWETQDIPLEDIERIEVIRGPGATLYGANAVNGVINIITKNAKDTHGTLLSAGTGTEERGFGHVRQGGQIGDDTHYRFYAKYANRDSQALASGVQSQDEWETFRTGYRFDLDATENDQITLIGDYYLATIGSPVRASLIDPSNTQVTPMDEKMWGADLLARWNHTVSETEDYSVQLFYDRNERDAFTFNDYRDVLDIDFQHHFEPIDRHDFIWGGGYRFVGDTLKNSPMITFDPLKREDHIFNAFIQDEIELLADELYFTIGSKIEHNEYSGFEFQPNARLVWTPHPKHAVWGSVSRAVRTPSRVEQDSTLTLATLPPNHPRNPFPVPSVLSLIGSRNVGSEELIAYELGYRYIPSDCLSFDLALFYNDYHNLLSESPGEATVQIAGGQPYLSVPFYFNNEMTGETYGVELAADVQLHSRWNIRSAYTLFDIQLHPNQPSFLKILEEYEHRTPHHQISILSMYDLTDQLELDIWARYVSGTTNSSNLPAVAFNISDYMALDVRLGWKPRENIEVVLGVQNILDDRRPEIGENLVSILQSEVERSVYLMTTWTF